MVRGRLCNLSGLARFRNRPSAFFRKLVAARQWREGFAPAGIEPFEEPSLNDLDGISQD
jgi:hypothetical protein